MESWEYNTKMMKKLIKISVLVLFEILVISGCKKGNDNPSNPYNGKTTAVFNPGVTYGTMTDQDGNTYKTVTIGNQTWMAENLRTTKYSDGSAIPIVTDKTAWTSLTIGAYCNYQNAKGTDTVATYGRLYNWYAATDSHNIAPIGWHVPTDAEWTLLTTFLGGESVAGGKMKETGTIHWFSPNTAATNESGFSATPSGVCIGKILPTAFDELGVQGLYWSCTQYDASEAWVLNLGHDITSCGHGYYFKQVGFAVRLVKDPLFDKPTNSNITYGTMSDQDGNVYKTVTIGTQTWMAENLRTTKYIDGTSIPNVTSASKWLKLTTGAYCNYNNTTSVDTIATYGSLYNWYAVNTGKLAPKDWHVPTNAEYSTLISNLGGRCFAGGKLKEAGTAHWLSPNKGSDNSYGFTALPGGYCSGTFTGLGIYGYWWSSTEDSETVALCTQIGTFGISMSNWIFTGENVGFSVRCVKD